MNTHFGKILMKTYYFVGAKVKAGTRFLPAKKSCTSGKGHPKAIFQAKTHNPSISSCGSSSPTKQQALGSLFRKGGRGKRRFNSKLFGLIRSHLMKCLSVMACQNVLASHQPELGKTRRLMNYRLRLGISEILQRETYTKFFCYACSSLAG
ncbi:hypothetical protein CEXT_418661 [Caerostris extrusa]|uniref:Uncharacterized protein n=1 Tax=Caerostris extrusa TaxID=172846 RepID=A0AAV4VMI5_CAEEX|nr:hypothetical protein CEXT_418661 [Caerostris extrusa]